MRLRFLLNRTIQWLTVVLLVLGIIATYQIVMGNILHGIAVRECIRVGRIADALVVFPRGVYCIRELGSYIEHTVNGNTFGEIITERKPIPISVIKDPWKAEEEE